MKRVYILGFAGFLAGASAVAAVKTLAGAVILGLLVGVGGALLIRVSKR